MMVALYRWLVHLYPRAFQEEYGREMTVAFRDRWAMEGGFGLFASTLYDTFATAAGAHWEMLVHDVRYAFRTLRKDRTFSAAAILTLALGIGATTAMFSLVHAVLFRPLPFAEPDRLMRVYSSNPERRVSRFATSIPDLVSWRERATSFEALAGIQFFDLNLTDGNSAERVQGMAVLGPFWRAAGQGIVHGRAFTGAENRKGNDGVAILSDALWERRFARDPGVLGREIAIDGKPRQIVGIAPADLNLSAAIDVFIPVVEDENRGRGDRNLNVIGRLKPGVTIAQAVEQLNMIAGQLEREFPESNAGWRANMITAKEWLVEPAMRRAIFVLLGAVGLLLAIACVNVANLLIARAAFRTREIGARLALGASKSRLLRQMITESLLLGCVGGVAGIALAWSGLRALTPLLPTFITRVELNGEVLAVACAVILASSLLFGIGPSLATVRGDIRDVLQASTRGAGATAHGSRRLVRQMLVMLQVALAAVLLVGALLILSSFARMLGQNFGFRQDHVLAARFSPPRSRVADEKQWSQYVEAITAEMRTLPGVKSAGITSEIPMGNVDTQQAAIAEERAAAIRTDGVQASWRLITRDYLPTIGVPLLKGRFWREGEDYRVRPVLISQNLAQRLWPGGEDPLGRQLRMSNGETFTVIGVTGDMRHRSLTDRQPTMTIYWPASLLAWHTMTLVIRTDGDPAAMAGAMREAMRRVDPMQPLFDVTTLEQFVSQVASAPRLATLLIGLFAGLALLLAAVGVAGLVAYAVAQRRPELAIRMALGASAARVIREVTSTQFVMCAAGVALGLGAAWSLRPVVASMLFEVEPGDPASFLGAGLILLLAALLACLLPSVRIGRIDPATVLRSE